MNNSVKYRQTITHINASTLGYCFEYVCLLFIQLVYKNVHLCTGRDHMVSSSVNVLMISNVLKNDLLKEVI